jgi:hypothetical protein
LILGLCVGIVATLPYLTLVAVPVAFALMGAITFFRSEKIQ